MVKAVRFDEYGAIDVLKVVDVPRPVPGPGQVLATRWWCQPPPEGSVRSRSGWPGALGSL